VVYRTKDILVELAIFENILLSFLVSKALSMLHQS
jgi:hypothetical protein